jgi:ABC-type polysaccharide/polyol phosphate transport system ATPase subunit
MIGFSRVSDHVRSSGRRLELLDRASIEIPVGRYCLLTNEPLARRPLIDLLCGTRPPFEGEIWRDGRSSWAIGRSSLFRGTLTGSDLLGMFCRIYDLDRSYAEAFVDELVEDKSLLKTRGESWKPLARAEFGQALALLPRFEIYVTDGNVLFSTGRFGMLWRRLFQERVAGRTLIISSLHISNIFAFCEKALIVDNGVISIVDELEEAVDRYPPRPPARESVRREDSAAESDGNAEAESF